MKQYSGAWVFVTHGIVAATPSANKAPGSAPVAGIV